MILSPLGRCTTCIYNWFIAQNTSTTSQPLSDIDCAICCFYCRDNRLHAYRSVLCQLNPLAFSDSRGQRVGCVTTSVILTSCHLAAFKYDIQWKQHSLFGLQARPGLTVVVFLVLQCNSRKLFMCFAEMTKLISPSAIKNKALP